MMLSYVLPLDLSTNATITIRLFKNVKNVPEIRKNVISGALQFCVLKPQYIVDPFQIAVAANKAQIAADNKQLVTRSLYTEILFNLSLSKNINQSLVKFGTDDKDIIILVAVVSKEKIGDTIFEIIDGESVNIEDLSQFCDPSLVKSNYKITEEELKVSSLLNSVVSKIATKDFL